MKHFVLSLLIALFAFSAVNAQNADDSNALKKLQLERDALQLDKDNLGRKLKGQEEQYNILDSLYGKLKKSYEELKKASDTSEFEKLQKQLNKSLSDIEAKNTKISELEGKNTQTKKALSDTIKNFNKAKKAIEANLKQTKDNLSKKDKALSEANEKLKDVDSLKKQIKGLQEDTVKKSNLLNDCNTKLSKALKDNEGLKKELEELKVFKIEWLKELAQRVDQEWLNKKYSQIDLAQIEQAYDQYSKYSVDDPMVAEAKNKMTPLVEGYRIYNKAMEAINAPYDEVLTKELLPELKAQRDKEQEPNRKDELKILARILGDYELIVGLFEELKSAIDTQISDLGDGPTHRMAYPLVKDVLKTFEEDGTIEAIEEVPYLKKRLEEYKKALNEDCIKCYKIELKLTK